MQLLLTSSERLLILFLGNEHLEVIWANIWLQLAGKVAALWCFFSLVFLFSLQFIAIRMYFSAVACFYRLKGFHPIYWFLKVPFRLYSQGRTYGERGGLGG